MKENVLIYGVNPFVISKIVVQRGTRYGDHPLN